MGLAEDLKSLEELNAKGKLNDAEFAAAKAAAIANYSKAASSNSRVLNLPAKKSSSSFASRIVLLSLIVLGCWWWYVAHMNDIHSSKPIQTAFKEAVHLPVDLKEETYNVQASSWRAVPIQVPYSGNLTISVQVLRGNPIQMFLTDDSNVEQLKSGATQFNYYG